jgi:sodium-dependent dicarboxylate transporter 2/3/5
MLKFVTDIEKFFWREHYKIKDLFSLNFSANRENLKDTSIDNDYSKTEQKNPAEDHINLRNKIGFILGILAFCALLFINPSNGMYVEATKIVLKHSDKAILQSIFSKSSIEKIDDIDGTNIDIILKHSEKILVKVPEDFAKTGEKGITLNQEGKPLSIIIKKQANGLKNTLAIAVIMAIFWISEALPIPVVALLPMVLLPLMGIAHYSRSSLPGFFTAFSPYMHYLVVLFIGGFTIAEAMKKWKLHERIALHFIRWIGFSQKRILLGLMVATAIVSMFVSNTATAAMMMPIAVAIIIQSGAKPGKSNFGLVLMLGIAYAASIGGIGTLIGTPPNVVLAGFLDTLLNKTVTFANWLIVGLPLVIVLLPLTWFLLMKMNPMEKVKVAESKDIIVEKLRSLGKIKGGERNTFIIFLLVALMWITRKQWTSYFHLYWVNDSVIAIVGVILFYILPVNIKKWEFTLDWKTNLKIPWGTLLLFGGGIALGQAMANTGAASFIAMHLTLLKNLPAILLIFFVVLLVDFLTEITSNTATTNMMMPILFALGVALSRDSVLLMIGGAVAASMAFMLPVATPPNAIVFGTGYVKINKLVRNGFVLDITAAITWTLLLYFLIQHLIHI